MRIMHRLTKVSVPMCVADCGLRMRNGRLAGGEMKEVVLPAFEDGVMKGSGGFEGQELCVYIYTYEGNQAFGSMKIERGGLTS